MARMTPHALSTTAPAQTAIRRPSDNRNDTARRIRRIRAEEAWAERTITRQTDSLMRGRYGVRM
jgi:hypothetical protein